MELFWQVSSTFGLSFRMLNLLMLASFGQETAECKNVDAYDDLDLNAW